jgi:biopolymer transport protein ExbD
MPSVKIPRKSTATDMTPFVDVAFLILSFFIMATKFKPPQPVAIATPTSVAADKLKEQDALLIEIDKTGKVYFTVNTQKQGAEAEEIKRAVIQNVNSQRNLGLTPNEIAGFVRNTTVGVPFSQLKKYLQTPDADRVKMFTGIPVTDSTNNELINWVAASRMAFTGRTMNAMIKGDNDAVYPSFKGVIDAFRKNDINKYQLVTDPEGAPVGSDLYISKEKALRKQ